MTTSSITDKLEELLKFVRRLKSSYYPEDWAYGPLPQIEEKLKEIIEESRD